MKLTCPACGYYGALEGFLAIEDYKKALSIICSLPGDLPTLFIRYLGLFRKPGSDRALTGSRILKICTQIEKLINNKELQWKNKRILENNPRYWAEAINILLTKDEEGRLKRPLTNNNLLCAIAYDIAEREFEEKARQKEESLRSGYRDNQVVFPEASLTGVLPPEEQLKRIQEIRKKLGMV
ncbi:hypothetical protein SAMN04488516_11718 [Desulfonauticus submarinus]|uniref:Uncharacterized protein n=1 Tax=Desulfonauticus submarinus TaxID=206665 RepID=A0A1H0G9U9_9BACT|nr:hypothetical protein [Desulfonauticus submarinus]SDO03640.1 hypothetical protein SAMN04488516_11718 [Desulfonauticus submarinus]